MNPGSMSSGDAGQALGLRGSPEASSASFASPLKDLPAAAKALCLEVNPGESSPWLVPAEPGSPSWGSVFHPWDSGSLVFSSFTGSQVCRVAQNHSELISSFRPRLRLLPSPHTPGRAEKGALVPLRVPRPTGSVAAASPSLHTCTLSMQ